MGRVELGRKGRCHKMAVEEGPDFHSLAEYGVFSTFGRFLCLRMYSSSLSKDFFSVGINLPRSGIDSDVLRIAACSCSSSSTRWSTKARTLLNLSSRSTLLMSSSIVPNALTSQMGVSWQTKSKYENFPAR